MILKCKGIRSSTGTALSPMLPLCHTAATLDRETHTLPTDRTAVRRILDTRWGLLAAQDTRNITGTALSPMFSLCHTAVTLGRASHGHTPTPDGQNHSVRRTLDTRWGLLAA